MIMRGEYHHGILLGKSPFAEREAHRAAAAKKQQHLGQDSAPQRGIIMGGLARVARRTFSIWVVCIRRTGDGGLNLSGISVP
jgi:hypothetical protein